MSTPEPPASPPSATTLCEWCERPLRLTTKGNYACENWHPGHPDVMPEFVPPASSPAATAEPEIDAIMAQWEGRPLNDEETSALRNLVRRMVRSRPAATAGYVHVEGTPPNPPMPSRAKTPTWIKRVWWYMTNRCTDCGAPNILYGYGSGAWTCPVSLSGGLPDVHP